MCHTFFCPHSSEISENSLYFLKVFRLLVGLCQLSTSISSDFTGRRLFRCRVTNVIQTLKRKERIPLGFVEITCCQCKRKRHVFHTGDNCRSAHTTAKPYCTSQTVLRGSLCGADLFVGDARKPVLVSALISCISLVYSLCCCVSCLA